MLRAGPASLPLPADGAELTVPPPVPPDFPAAVGALAAPPPGVAAPPDGTFLVPSSSGVSGASELVSVVPKCTGPCCHSRVFVSPKVTGRQIRPVFPRSKRAVTR
ncbi:hypothetical protein AF335_03110 [Streptomyces eurocidicus]|uniref:Uncharacterized protein n=1 Tax=Streptomyces eurocidicus TaxID=66423 RepID=A0A2N8P2V8_STREU|nr:hypothetical protein AF335_03110 [Streptomyces eurocidicus]